MSLSTWVTTFVTWLSSATVDFCNTTQLYHRSLSHCHQANMSTWVTTFVALSTPQQLTFVTRLNSNLIDIFATNIQFLNSFFWNLLFTGVAISFFYTIFRFDILLGDRDLSNPNDGQTKNVWHLSPLTSHSSQLKMFNRFCYCKPFFSPFKVVVSRDFSAFHESNPPGSLCENESCSKTILAC